MQVRPVVCIGERALNASAAGLQAFSERMHTTARSFADDSNRAEESAGDSTQQASSQEHQQPQHEDAGSRPEESASEQPPPTIESLQAIIEEHRATAQQHAASVSSSYEMFREGPLLLRLILGLHVLSPKC